MNDDYFWRGEKVELRQFRKDDLERKRNELYDSPARRFLQDGILDLPAPSLDQYGELFTKTEAKLSDDDIGKPLFLAIENFDKELVGWINLWQRNPRSGVFEYGISIFRNFQRRGYAADAIKIILRYGFYELRMQKCNSACNAENTASVKLHKSLGFKEEGCRRREIFTDNRYCDLQLFGLLKEEFAESR